MSLHKHIRFFISVFFIHTFIISISAQDKLRFKPDDNLATIREKIKANKYSFKVGETWVYKLPKEQKAKMFGRHPGKIKLKLAIPETGPLLKVIGKQLPESYDTRNIDGKTYIGGVRDQGSAGTCYSFGACAAAEASYNLATGKYDSNCADFSESYIAWCLGSLSEYNVHFYGGEGADYDYYELKALTKEGLYPQYDGVTTEAQCPYSETAINADNYLGKVTTIQFDSWERVYPVNFEDTTQYIKTAIMTYGAVDAAVYVTGAFEAYTGGIYEDTNTDPSASPYYNETTNHAISLVGWDDTPDEGGGGCWILRNSWGKNWGEDGYMRIRYKSAAVNCAASYIVYSDTPATATMTMAASPTDGGTTTPVVGDSTVNTGEAQSISATPAADHTFSHWSTSGNATFGDAYSSSTTVTLTNESTITANFNSNGGTSTLLTMEASPSAGGTTTPTAGTSSVTVNEAQNITATANEGYIFSGWVISGNGTVADSSSASTTVTLAGNSTVTASFSAISDTSIGSLTINTDSSNDNKDRIVITKAEYPSGSSVNPQDAEVVIDGVSYTCSGLIPNVSGSRYVYKSISREPNVVLTIDINKMLWSLRVSKTDIHDDIDPSDGITVVLKIDGSTVVSRTVDYADLGVKTKIKYKQP